MAEIISEKVWNILTCCYCGAALTKTPDGAACSSCGLKYQGAGSIPLDLRLKKQKTYNLAFELNSSFLPENGFAFKPIEMNPAPEVDFTNVRVPRHLTREMMSYFPKAKSKDSLALDLGCGDAVHREVMERAGFEWVGLDYEETSRAQMLGDAHSLPFKDNSFDFVLFVTVLQYARFPFVMMREIHRVLRPGGKLIGTVPFLEPTHGVTFYTHTHLGTYNTLQHGGFKVEVVAPSAQWSGLIALASMGMFHGMPRLMAQSIVYPLQLLHQLWWKIGGLLRGKDLTNTRIRNFTGSFTFIASK